MASDAPAQPAVIAAGSGEALWFLGAFIA